jgi:hypothetical protein
MRIHPLARSANVGCLGFTLPELMIASLVSLAVGGSAVLVLFQGAREQQRGLADTTVEEKAHLLESTIAGCLRPMSANQGMSPDYSSALHDPDGDVLGYQTIYFFCANTNGGYTTEQIRRDPTSGRVTYTPDISRPGSSVVWMTNSPTVALRQLCFSTSLNPDGSFNSSLINVMFLMDDNGASHQGDNNNPASIHRSFSVQMRGDF